MGSWLSFSRKSSSATCGAEECPFLARRQLGTPPRILLVHARRNRRPKFRQLRKSPPVALENILHARPIGKLRILRRNARNFLELPVEKHAHAHSGILARARVN